MTIILIKKGKTREKSKKLVVTSHIKRRLHGSFVCELPEMNFKAEASGVGWMPADRVKTGMDLPSAFH